MENIEKALFLKVRQYQYSISEDLEIAKTFSEMNEVQRGEYVNLSRELHNIWNYINSDPVLNSRPDDGVTSVQAYHEKINPVSDVILKVINEFNFTLKNTMTKKEKEAIIAILGENYFNEKYSDIDIIDDVQ